MLPLRLDRADQHRINISTFKWCFLQSDFVDHRHICIKIAELITYDYIVKTFLILLVLVLAQGVTDTLWISQRRL